MIAEVDLELDLEDCVMAHPLSSQTAREREHSRQENSLSYEDGISKMVVGRSLLRRGPTTCHCIDASFCQCWSLGMVPRSAGGPSIHAF